MSVSARSAASACSTSCCRSIAASPASVAATTEARARAGTPVAQLQRELLAGLRPARRRGCPGDRGEDIGTAGPRPEDARDAADHPGQPRKAALLLQLLPVGQGVHPRDGRLEEPVHGAGILAGGSDRHAAAQRLNRRAVLEVGDRGEQRITAGRLVGIHCQETVLFDRTAVEDRIRQAQASLD